MNRNDLQAMLYHIREVSKIIYGSEECKHDDCNKCGYYVICNINELLQSLIEHEADKDNIKRSVKDDNN